MKERTSITGLNQIKKYIRNESYVVVYLDYKILFGNYKDGDFFFFNDETFDLKFVQKIRLFNKDEEFYIWRENGNLFGRLKKDDNLKFVDSIQVLMGTESQPINSEWTKITEYLRGTEFVLPGVWVVNNKREKVALKVRNYIGYTENHLATYTDSRFVEFVQLPIEGGR
jgi:CRISPR-associated protein (TIGR03984 family)